AESIAQVSIPSSGSESLPGKVVAQQSMREEEPSSESQPVSDWPIWQPISAEEKARETMGPAEQQQPIYDARTSAPFALPLQRKWGGSSSIELPPHLRCRCSVKGCRVPPCAEFAIPGFCATRFSPTKGCFGEPPPSRA